MSYRVFWAPNAEAKLEHFIDAGPDPTSLAAAARQMDRHLVNEPASFGESRYDTIRIGFAYPLGVQFEVMDDVQTVIVHDVWRIDRS
jgi:hypothetical protein